MPLIFSSNVMELEGYFPEQDKFVKPNGGGGGGGGGNHRTLLVVVSLAISAAALLISLVGAAFGISSLIGKGNEGSTSRQLLGTAADAVVIGGGDSSTLDFYSSKTGTFCSKPLLLPQPTSPKDHHRSPPPSLYGSFAAFAGGVLLLCGGKNSTKCFQLNPSSSPSWFESRFSLPSTLQYPAAIVLSDGKTVWVTGGRSGSGDAVSSTFFIHPRFGVSTGGPKLPTPLYGHCLVVLPGGDGGGRFLLAGGSPPSDRVYVGRMEEGAAGVLWFEQESMEHRREGAACAVLDQSGASGGGDPVVAVAGGHDGEGPLDTVEMFNLKYLTWVRARPMSRPRYYGGAIPIADESGIPRSLLVAGGAGQDGSSTGSCEILDSSTGDWTASSGKRNLRSARAFFAVAALPEGEMRC